MYGQKRSVHRNTRIEAAIFRVVASTVFYSCVRLIIVQNGKEIPAIAKPYHFAGRTSRRLLYSRSDSLGVVGLRCEVYLGKSHLAADIDDADYTLVGSFLVGSNG